MTMCDSTTHKRRPPAGLKRSGDVHLQEADAPMPVVQRNRPVPRPCGGDPVYVHTVRNQRGWRNIVILYVFVAPASVQSPVRRQPTSMAHASCPAISRPRHSLCSLAVVARQYETGGRTRCAWPTPGYRASFVARTVAAEKETKDGAHAQSRRPRAPCSLGFISWLVRMLSSDVMRVNSSESSCSRYSRSLRRLTTIAVSPRSDA